MQPHEADEPGTKGRGPCLDVRSRLGAEAEPDQVGVAAGVQLSLHAVDCPLANQHGPAVLHPARCRLLQHQLCRPIQLLQHVCTSRNTIIVEF